MRPRRARWWATTTVAVLTAALAVGGLAPSTVAVADTAPKNPADITTPETVSTDVLPTPQIGDGSSAAVFGDTKGAGVVWDQVVVGDTVYVGGQFGFARPAGAAKGEKVVVRSNFLAYDLKTGALLDYAPSFNGTVLSMAVSTDQKTLYVGGTFTSVNNVTRYRLAAFDVATGALTSFAPSLNASVRAMAVSNSTLYIGGVFTSVQKAARGGLAALSMATGAVTAWQPVAQSGTVLALLVSPDESKVIVGGRFTTLNGSDNPGRSMGAVRADTGTSLPWKINGLIRNGGANSGITSLTSSGDSVYGTAFLASAAEGKFEGTFRATWADGTTEWLEDCHGDTYSVAVSQGVAYTASHAHDCQGVKGFVEGTTSGSSDIYHRALAFSTMKTQTLRPFTGDVYGNYADQPAPSLLDWYPDFEAGRFTGTAQAAWDVTTAQGYVLMGGEFPKVNGVAQQGLARFAPKSIAPNRDGPRLENASMVPTVKDYGTGTVRLSWPANYDRDNASLTYQVIQDGNTAKPAAVQTVDSRFWQRPTVTSFISGLTIGRAYQFRIRVLDPWKNVKWGNPVTVTPTGVASTPLGDYDRAVLSDGARNFWPLNEATGAVGVDYAASNDLSFKSAVTRQAPGPESTDSSTSFSGVNSYAASTEYGVAPDNYSSEAWFSTSSTKGGGILAFSSTTGTGPDASERKVYMTDAGQLVYAVSPVANDIKYVRSQGSYNDGKWHHVVATLGANGMQLFVDGGLVASQKSPTTGYAYSGYWSVGGHLVGTMFPSSPTSNFLPGSIADVAIYGSVLSDAQVKSHNEAHHPSPSNQVPQASFGTSSSGLVAQLDGSGSSDADGRIAAFAWDFGDGSTGTGEKASHTYGAAGTFTVKLTVTDDKGATNSVSKAVTVTAPVKPDAGAVAADAFERSVAAGWSSAVTGGAWKQSGHSGGTSVAGGVGVLASGKGQTRSMMLPSVSASSTDSTVSFRIDKAPSGGGQFVSVVGRQVGADSYSARVWVHSNGVLQLQLQRGGTVLKAVNLTGVPYSVGQKVFVRLQVTGSGTTTLNARAWTTGAEPTVWQATATDTTAALQAAGSVGLSTYLSGTSAADAVFSVDDYRVVKTG